MKERYLILKRFYPDYLIFFINDKDETKCIEETRIIMDEFDLKRLKYVNKLTVYNLEIIEKEEYENNLYELFLFKAKLCKWIKGYKEDLHELQYEID